MEKKVKRRQYKSPLRERQAEATRAAIMDAAQQLFVANGYVATSIKAIAEEADVSEATIYAQFGNKASLLWDAIIRAVVGEGGDPTTAYPKDFVHAVQSEPDLQGRTRMVLHASRMGWERGAAELEVVLVGAADADPRLLELVEKAAEGRLEGTREGLSLVLGPKKFVSGVEFEEVAELIWAINSPQVYRALVRNRGWSPEQYEDWITKILMRTLYPDME